MITQQRAWSTKPLIWMVSVIFSCGGMALNAQESNRYLLISAEQNLRLESWSLTSGELPFASEVEWSVRKQTLHGGKQEGVDLVVIDNGSLAITVIPTRGMSVLEVRRGEVRLGWDSPIKEVVHPQFINLESRGGLGWLEGFNEWMVRCGLEFAGHPGRDEFVTNTGDKAEMMLTLHGKVGNTPASEVEVIIDKEPPHRIRVRGLVRESVFHGPKLELHTEISTEPGSDSFRIHDQVTNRSAFDQEFQIIYHTNFGTPLLEPNAQLVVPAASVTPMNAHAAKAVKSYATYSGPMPGFVEEVYLIEPLAGEDGHVLVLLKNAAGDLGASIRWAKGQLPYFTQWKNTASPEDGYVTGLEPGTGFPFNRRVERQFGRVPKLGPGQTQEFSLEYGVHAGVAAVNRIEDRIKRIQGDHQTEIVAQPPEINH